MDFLNTEFGHAVVLAGAFLVLFAMGEILYHIVRIKVEYTRKFVHITTALLALAFPIYLNNHWFVMALSLIFAGILVLSLKFDLLKSINAIERSSVGSLCAPAAIYATFMAYHFSGDQLYYYYIPLSILAISDPLAALFGKRFPWRPYSIRGNSKTLMGSMMFFLSAFLVSFSFMHQFDFADSASMMILQSLCVAGMSMTTEAFSDKGWDNLFIPLSVIVVLGLFAI
jgi:phytol kinase